jgi:hypothetical protein
MSVATRATGCSMLKLLVEGQQYIVNDHETIQELATFSKKNNKYQAEEGRKDDLVMGLVVFAWLSNQKYFKNLTDIDTIGKLREKRQEDIEDQLVPFGFIDRGPPADAYPITAELAHREFWFKPKVREYSPYVHNASEEDDNIEWMPNF